MTCYSLFPLHRVFSLTFLLLLLPGLLSAQECNLFPFPGFEVGNSLSAWEGNDGVQPGPSGLSRSDVFPFSGSWSGKLQVSAPGASLTNSPSLWDAAEGQAYRVICWVRSTADSAQLQLSIDRVSTASQLADTTWFARTQWYRMELLFSSPATANQDIRIRLTANAAADTNAYELFVDEVSMCEYDNLDGCNLVGFPGFEGVNYQDTWTHYNGGTPGSSAMLLSGNEVYDGQFSGRLKINYMGQYGGQISTWRQPFTVDSQNYYTLSCRIKSSLDSVTVRPGIVRKSAYKLMAETDFELDTTWRRFTWTFEADETWVNDAYLRFRAQNYWTSSGYDIYFDEVKLCQAGGLPIEAPGTVNQGLRVWLKANEGPDDDPLTEWVDQSGNDNSVNIAANGPEWLPEAINGNPAVRFDGNITGFTGTQLGLNALAQQHSWYAVIRSENSPANATAISFGGQQSGYRLEVNNSQEWKISGTNPGVPGLGISANEWTLIAVHASDSAFEAFVQGQSIYSGGTLSAVGGNGTYVIGAADNIGTHPWTGEIAELLFYNQSLSTAARHEIESYLAIKYGFTIPTASHQYYAHSSHSLLTTGIGRDEGLQGLNQAASRNLDTTHLVRISRPSQMRDGDFLVWGHDGAALTTSNNVPPGINSRILRTWRISETGDINKVLVHADFRGLGLDFSQPYRWSLLIDEDGDFSNAQVVGGPYVDGEEFGFPGVSFDDGQWFSFGLSNSAEIPVAPGAVHEGMALWLTADQGPSLSTGFRWKDRSRRKNDALPGGIGPRIEEEALNENAVVRFDDNNDWLHGAGSLDLSPNDHSWYIVAKTEDITNWRNPIVLRSSGYRLEVRGNQHTWSVYGADPNSLNSNQAVDDWHLVHVLANPSETILYTDGLLAHARQTRSYLRGEGPYVLAARNVNGGSAWDGDIAEVLVYTQGHTLSQRRAVQSYFSVKYGITIPVSDHQHFNHLDFPYNLAGIGRDETQQGLHQSSGRSINETSRVKIDNPAQLDEAEYLVWGHDGDSLDLDTNTPAGYPYRLARTWRVEETGEVGSVSISFFLSGLGFDTSDPAFFALLVDEDGDFSNASPYPALVINGQELRFNDIPLNDGSFFSLAVPQQSTDLDPNVLTGILDFRLYPNPSLQGSSLQVEFTSSNPQRMRFQILDIQGRELFQRVIHHAGGKGKLELASHKWPAGIYLVQCHTASGVISRKWVIR